MIKVTHVNCLKDWRLALEFSDGARGERDFVWLLKIDTTPVKPLHDKDYFAKVFLERGAPTWPNGFDLAPWALHEDMAKDGALNWPQPVS